MELSDRLSAHGGFVRGGIRSALFHAEPRLLQAPPKPGEEAAMAEGTLKGDAALVSARSLRAATRTNVQSLDFSIAG